MSFNKLTSLLLFLTIMSNAYSQHKPSAYSNSIKPNFVRTHAAKRPLTDIQVVISNTDVAEVSQSTNYFDGIGRKIQTVKKQYTPGKTDLVSPTIYDDKGRESYRFLDFSSTTNNGHIKLDPFAEQESFYNTYLSGQGQVYFYEQTHFEPSPLNREKQKFSPGNSWVGANRGISNAYETNVANEVRHWSLGFVSGNVPTSSGFYAAGEIYRFTTTDEHGKRIIEYKDKENKLILKKVEHNSTGASNASSHTGWLCTYYIYDEMNNLRWVIQPVGVESLISSYNWSFDNTNISSSSLAQEQCFYYEYDSRKRMILKNVPGAGLEEMVYDSRDRLVMSRHANLANQGFWEVKKYDQLNRLVRMYLIANSSSRATNQTNASANINYPTVNASDLMQENFYDDYSWITPTPQQGIGSTLHAADFTSAFFIMNFNAAPDFAQPVVADYVNVKGKQTGSKVRIFGTITYLHSVLFYDEEGREIQKREANISGGHDIYTTQYDFRGKALRRLHRHYKNGANTRFVRELTKYTYDHAERVTQVTKKIGTNSSTERIVVKNTYDELGKLKVKSIGDSIETQTHKYNVRGWLLNVNENCLKYIENNYFAYQLGYDTGYNFSSNAGNFSQPQYNGNISGVIWQTLGSTWQSRYDYFYDDVNRICSADFRQHINAEWNRLDGKDFSVPAISYDANGNILKLKQKGYVFNTSRDIDNLTYSYFPNSNKLAKVTDSVNDPSDKFGDFKDGQNAGDDYEYDFNGNLKKDNNKGITSILYTHHNTPYEVRFQGKGKILFTYDNLDRKLKKVVHDSTGTTPRIITWLYIDNYIYRNDTMQTFSHEEGVARFDTTQTTFEATKFYFEYFLKDHLGNVRTVLTEKKDTTKYVPLTFEGSSGSQEQILQDKVWENKTGESVNILASRITRPGAFGNNTTNGTYATLVRKSTGAIGPGKLLKVMKGDVLHISVDYFYTAINADNSNSDGVQSLIANFASTIMNSVDVSSVLKNQSSAIVSDLENSTDLASILNTPNNVENGNNAPKAYLNVLFFYDDLQHICCNAAEQVIPVEYAPNEKKTISLIESEAVNIYKNGYIYVYVSNESDEMVYFDNLILTHEKGPLVEEKHYYPYGLTMAGISSKAFGEIGSKYGFNGNEIQNKEFNDGSGLELYDFNARTYDQQLGRFIQIDPMGEEGDQESLTPYQFGFDNPVRYSDPDGKCPSCIIGFIVGGLVDYGTQVAGNLIKGESLGDALTNVDGSQILISGVAGALTGGVSAFVPKGLAGKVLKTGIETAIDATESVAQQLKQDGSVSIGQVVGDVVTSQVGGALTKNVKVADTKSTQKQLDRAERIAANDPKSTGRAANVKEMKNKLATEKGANQAANQTASGSVTNSIKSVGTALLSGSNASSTPSNQNFSDNTAIKKPIPNIVAR